MQNLLMIKNPTSGSKAKRDIIKSYIQRSSENIKTSTITRISTEDLQKLFEMYDDIFFDNWFKTNYKGKVKFSLSKRMTKSAGQTICPKNISKIKPEDLVIEVKISTDFFFQYSSIGTDKSVCGVKTEDSLEALMIVLEHELCHVIEFIIFNTSSCSKKRFKSIANNIFGHIESYHRLPTYRQIAEHKYGFTVGDTIDFIFNGNRLSGVVYSIKKRAVVMVKDKVGLYVDQKGDRYTKYYVPLDEVRGYKN